MDKMQKLSRNFPNKTYGMLIATIIPTKFDKYSKYNTILVNIS